MSNNELSEKFISSLAAMFGTELSRDTRLVENLNARSSHYYMIIAEMEDLGAPGVPYSKVKACTTIGEIADLLADLAG